MRERHLAGPRPCSASDQPLGRGRVVGARKGRCRGSAPSPARRAVDARDLERLLGVGGAQDARKAPGDHRLAGAGRPTMRTLWPPAAAISRARFASRWPRTSRGRGRCPAPTARAEPAPASSDPAAGPRAAPGWGPPATRGRRPARPPPHWSLGRGAAQPAARAPRAAASAPRKARSPRSARPHPRLRSPPAPRPAPVRSQPAHPSRGRGRISGPPWEATRARGSR